MIFFSVAFMQAASGSQFSTSVASTTATLSILGVAAITGIIYWLQHRKRSMAKPPTQWKPVGKVEKLFLYPLKSGNSISLDSAECTLLGLRESSDEKKGKFVFQDRFFLIYQEGSQKFLTARQKNQTLVITATSNGENEVTLSSPNCDYPVTFKVPSNESEYKKVECSVHSNEIVDTVDCGDEVASWLSKVIFDKENSLRLGYHVLSPSVIRHRSVKSPSLEQQSKVYTDMTDDDLGAYSDIASYMVLSQESVVDLNKRLEDSDKITDRNFRPNIVVSGCNINAYDEDGWQWLKIGDEVIMKGFKPCTRCLMVTLDPVKGVANPTKEPLLTLKKYRQVTDPKMKEVEGTSPVFGKYFGIYKMGNISVGDTIYVPV